MPRPSPAPIDDCQILRNFLGRAEKGDTGDVPAIVTLRVELRRWQPSPDGRTRTWRHPAGVRAAHGCSRRNAGKQTICNASAMTSSHRGTSCRLCLARCFTLIGVNFSKTARIAFCRNSFLSPCAAPSTKPFRSLMARLMAFKACWCPSSIYLFSRRVEGTNGHSRLHELLPRSTTHRVLHRSPFRLLIAH